MTADEPTDPWLIVPGRGFGPITANRSHDDLVAVFGSDQVIHRLVGIGEGFCATATVVFPDSPNAVQILWSDENQSRPGVLRIDGTDSLSRWHTSQDIRLGMTSRELEDLNGGRFTFAGQEWDGAGWVYSWEGGALTALDPSLSFQLVADPDSNAALAREPKAGEIVGDHPVPSDHPAVRLGGFRVGAITLELVSGAPNEERFCG